MHIHTHAHKISVNACAIYTSGKIKILQVAKFKKPNL